MADDKKLTSLDEITSSSGSNTLLYVVDTSGSAPIQKKIKSNNFFNSAKFGGTVYYTSFEANGTMIMANGAGISASSGSIVVGGFEIYKEETATSEDWINLKPASIFYNINPTLAVPSYYCGLQIDMQQQPENINEIAGMRALVSSVSSASTSGSMTILDNMVANTTNRTSTTGVKGIWSYGLNYSEITQFYYALQANVSNYAYNDGNTDVIGDIALARAGRFRIDNITGEWGTPTPSLGANIYNAQVVYGDINNQGSASQIATISYGTGFAYSLYNNTNGSIINSYGMKMTTPVNSGSITNHYGIYLEDQTVLGSSLNYALYVAGGESKFKGITKFGDDSNYTKFETDGTMIMAGSATVWDDLFFPLTTAKQGQTDKPPFSTTEIAYLFPSADTSNIMYIIAQFPHSYKLGTDVQPHIHWKQTQSGSPVFKMNYKWFNIGDPVPSIYTPYTMSDRIITWTSGSIHQLSSGSASISGSSITNVSSIMLIELYRDDNAYTGDCITYQFDIHFQKDSIGSRTNLSK
jgi:hypothetical protein